MNNLTYTGKTYFGQNKRVNGRIEAQPKENWTLLPDVTPQIITEDIFAKVQEAMKDARDSRPVKPNAAYLLTGAINTLKELLAKSREDAKPKKKSKAGNFRA